MKIMNWVKFNESVESSDHSYYLPSYEECREICDTNGNLIFYETKHNVDGYIISVFNYRLASYNHFVNPIPNKPNVKAFEMRGICFVWNKDGSVFKRYLLLDKFFNMDQTPCSSYSIIKNFKIRNVYVKEDGSVASFVMLPNGKVFAKSKTSFESEQAVEIQNIYNNSTKIKEFVNWALRNDINPIFEYVSPRNRIVIQYNSTDLILLKLRDNNTGEYLNIEDYIYKLDGITLSSPDNDKSLDDLIELKTVVKDIEGWVVQFQNGKMVKIKGDHYCSLHGLLTNSLNRENEIIELIIDEKIDDVIAQIPEDDERRDDIDQIIRIVNDELINISNDIDPLIDIGNTLIKDQTWSGRREFAIKYKKDKYFGIIMSILNGKDKVDVIKNRIKEQTKNLMMARTWLEKRGYTKR